MSPTLKASTTRFRKTNINVSLKKKKKNPKVDYFNFAKGAKSF